jgi:hypothetical protein
MNGDITIWNAASGVRLRQCTPAKDAIWALCSTNLVSAAICHHVRDHVGGQQQRLASQFFASARDGSVRMFQMPPDYSSSAADAGQPLSSFFAVHFGVDEPVLCMQAALIPDACARRWFGGAGAAAPSQSHTPLVAVGGAGVTPQAARMQLDTLLTMLCRVWAASQHRL